MFHARKRKGVVVLVAVFVLAFAGRAAAGGFLLRDGPDRYVLSSDDGDAYDAAARWQALDTPVVRTPRMDDKWAHASSVMDRWPQGYWLFLAAQYALWRSAYVSTIFLQALIGAFGVLAGYALARTVLSEAGAVLAGVALALSSTGVILAAALYPESVYIPLVVGGLALAARSNRASAANPRLTGHRWLLLAGLAFGLAEATRPLAVVVFASVVGWCAWPWARSGWNERVQRAICVCLGFTLGIAAFVAHDLVTLGRVTMFTVGGAEAFADLHNSAGFGLGERLLLLFGTGGWAPLAEPLVSYAGALAAPLRFAEVVAGAVGLVWLMRRGAVGQPIASLLCAATLAIVIPPLFLGLPLVRYRAPADPLIIVGMVAALEAAWRALAWARRDRQPAWLT